MWIICYFKEVCKSDKCDSSRSIPKKGQKGKRFNNINQEKIVSMDNLADQVQSLFYHNVHFNSINTRMHTEIECRTNPNGNVIKQTFKFDTGADGNLMPITMFTRVFPKIILDALEETIKTGVTLSAYNNTPIRQFGTCSVRLSFKEKAAICKFFLLTVKWLLLE